MYTVKDFFEMTKLIGDVNIDIDIYYDVLDQKKFESLAYSYDGEQKIFLEILERYGARRIAHIKFCFEDMWNTVCFDLTLFPD